MAKCVRCGKFSLFKSFPNGLCDDCIAAIDKEEREKELREKQERLRKEIAEQERIIAEAEEQLRLAEALQLPDVFWGSRKLAYDYEDVKLFVPDPNLFSKMSVGTKLNAFQDKDNPYDKNAVRLEWNNDTLAYFYRGKLQDMANDYLMFGGHVHGVITSLAPDDSSIFAHLGYYKGANQDELKSLYFKNSSPKPYKLTGSSAAYIQENLFMSSVGEKCDLEFDSDKEKYLVTAGDALGYLPASAAKLVEEHDENNCSVYIAEIGMNDSGKYFVSVYVFVE